MPESEPSEGMLRLFIAVTAPPPVVALATAAIGALRGCGDVRWTPPERLHLTLKFLGATPPARLEEIGAALEENANKFSPFMVECGGAGAFPSSRKPQVIWLGLTGERVARLAALAGEIEGAVEPLGFEKERRAFRPHLTLGRVKSSRGLGELARRLQELERGETRMAAWPIDELHLVRSLLRPQGPEYSVLKSYPLTGEVDRSRPA